MYIKYLLFIFISLFIMFGCQPEQTRWPESESDRKASPGDFAYELLAKKLANSTGCKEESTLFLKNNKTKFITNINNLINMLAEGSEEEKMHILVDFLKEQEKSQTLVKIADQVESLSQLISPGRLALIAALFSQTPELSQILVRALHNRNLEYLLTNLSTMSTSSLIAHVKPLSEEIFAGINTGELAQKISLILKNSPENTRIAQQILSLIKKFSQTPALKTAVVKLQEILVKIYPQIAAVYPEISTRDIAQSIELLNKHPEALDASRKFIRYSKYLLPIYQVFNHNEIPEALSNFADIIIADENIYNLVMSNTRILYNAGVIDDIREIARFVEQQKKSTLKNPEQAMFFINLARKLFPINKPLLKAPVVIIAQVLLQVLTANEQEQCQAALKDPNFASRIEQWSKSLVRFMRNKQKWTQASIFS